LDEIEDEEGLNQVVPRFRLNEGRGSDEESGEEKPTVGYTGGGHVVGRLLHAQVARQFVMLKKTRMLMLQYKQMNGQLLLMPTQKVLLLLITEKITLERQHLTGTIQSMEMPVLGANVDMRMVFTATVPVS